MENSENSHQQLQKFQCSTQANLRQRQHEQPQQSEERPAASLQGGEQQSLQKGRQRLPHFLLQNEEKQLSLTDYSQQPVDQKAQLEKQQRQGCVFEEQHQEMQQQLQQQQQQKLEQAGVKEIEEDLRQKQSKSNKQKEKQQQQLRHGTFHLRQKMCQQERKQVRPDPLHQHNHQQSERQRKNSEEERQHLKAEQPCGEQQQSPPTEALKPSLHLQQQLQQPHKQPQKAHENHQQQLHEQQTQQHTKEEEAKQQQDQTLNKPLQCLTAHEQQADKQQQRTEEHQLLDSSVAEHIGYGEVPAEVEAQIQALLLGDNAEGMEMGPAASAAAARKAAAEAAARQEAATAAHTQAVAEQHCKREDHQETRSPSYEETVDLDWVIRSIVRHSKFSGRPRVFYEDGEYKEEVQTEEQHEAELRSLIRCSPHVILERYGECVDDRQLELFQNHFATTPEVQFYVKALQRKRSALESSRSRVAANRRLRRLQQLQEEGVFFSEEAMKERQPALYHTMIGRYTKVPTSSRSSSSQQTPSHSSTSAATAPAVCPSPTGVATSSPWSFASLGMQHTSPAVSAGSAAVADKGTASYVARLPHAKTQKNDAHAAGDADGSPLYRHERGKLLSSCLMEAMEQRDHHILVKKERHIWKTHDANLLASVAVGAQERRQEEERRTQRRQQLQAAQLLLLHRRQPKAAAEEDDCSCTSNRLSRKVTQVLLSRRSSSTEEDQKLDRSFKNLPGEGYIHSNRGSASHTRAAAAASTSATAAPGKGSISNFEDSCQEEGKSSSRDSQEHFSEASGDSDSSLEEEKEEKDCGDSVVFAEALERCCGKRKSFFSTGKTAASTAKKRRRYLGAARYDEHQQEFLTMMHHKFLEGEDSAFVDYSAIDCDEALDDWEQIDRDLQEEYFIGDDEAENENKTENL